jgi:acetyl esterase/lipase
MYCAVSLIPTGRLLAMLAAIAVAATLWLAAAARAAASDGEKLSLWPDQAPLGDGRFEAANASITIHRPAPEKANGAAVVICPGGGYGGLMVGPEGHGIAKWLNQHGIAGIVLEYRLPRGRPFVPLLDAQRAIRTVRFNAKQWNIDPNRIGIIGFSAGGHLAATAGTHFDGGDPQAADPIDRVSCRADFAILIYPVITMSEKTHGGSRDNLLGRDPKPEMVDLFSNEKQVTDKTPPMFLAHAKDDTAVVPDNSRMMYEALKARKVAAEYLELPSGGHGLNGYKGPMWDAWQTKSLGWLAAQKLIP